MRYVLALLLFLISAAGGWANVAYDQTQNMPMGVAFVPDKDGSPGAQVILQFGRFHCPEGQRRALWINVKTHGAWIGCWRVEDGRIKILMESKDELDVGSVQGDIPPGEAPSKAVPAPTGKPPRSA